jgi:hypothetical protein
MATRALKTVEKALDGYEAWRPALIAFYERDELKQKALNLKNGASLDYLDRRCIEAMMAAAERMPRKAA